MWCSGCERESEFERIDCADHGADCLELVCVTCGAGVELAPAVVVVTEPRVEAAA